ncbi:tetraacyldisaccharide 4'-kinase [Faecalibacter rhinopitheci]|uniref:Tetraacyldisaccharide 4'-kinase n=1 Tax=Faecalibacter rhinopitheci TaxID=2779678 RepID=A0A8J7FVH0_9FLAO|nr:tetraacyldisaccharide 4'-kinase [Faecalibacter rhinopitheci]MBF0596208.1 tetraacyldisaccharide 4'-kinase [Faecalibacter rhinopitheci]
MNWRRLLLPFSGIYWGITSIRNFFYDVGVRRTASFDLPIINVGNLSVGGTGKSPHVMYLIELLKDQKMTCTLSRGYGRKTSGFRIANYDSKVYDIGDEPMQFFRRFKNKILISVCERRVFGVQSLLKHFYPEVIILDDAFQHRKIKAGFNILLTDYNHPYFEDYLLPGGDLRESRRGAKRADVIIVTKCPETIPDDRYKVFQEKIKLTGNQQLFFSKIVYDNVLIGEMDNIPHNDWKNKNVILVTGIANPTSLVNFAEANFKNVLHLKYPDHHNFKDVEIDYIRKRFAETEGEKIIVTTEKDYMRLFEEKSLINDMYYLPIRIELNDKEKFNQTILDYVRTH